MKKHSIKLIEGDFTKDKAKSLLLELLMHKINFHKLEKFSNEIRFNEDREHSEKRIDQLTEEKQKLISWITQLETNEEITIKADIQLQIK